MNSTDHNGPRGGGKNDENFAELAKDPTSELLPLPQKHALWQQLATSATRSLPLQSNIFSMRQQQNAVSFSRYKAQSRQQMHQQQGHRDFQVNQSQQKQHIDSAEETRPAVSEQVSHHLFCRYVICVLINLTIGQADPVDLVNTFETPIRNLWEKWANKEIDTTALVDNAVYVLRSICSAARNLNVVVSFRTWYLQQI